MKKRNKVRLKQQPVLQDPFAELARFQQAIRGLDLQLRVTMAPISEFPIDLDLYETSWVDEQGRHLGGRCASLATLSERLYSLKDDVERRTGLEVAF